MLINIDKREPEFSFNSDVFIVLTQQAYKSLFDWVYHFKTEISGCGMVSRLEGDDGSVRYLVDEVFLPEEQTNSSASTDIDASMVHKLMNDLLKEGKDTAKLKMHWHSHASMNVFHSGTDKDNYKDLNNGDFLVSLVLNREGDILGGLHLYGAYKLNVRGVPVYVHMPMPERDAVTEKAIKSLEAFTEKNKKVIGYHFPAVNGYDPDFFSKFVWDNKTQKYVPKDKKLKKETLADRKKALGETFNSVFEYCDPGDGVKCRTCVDEVMCTKYWGANW